MKKILLSGVAFAAMSSLAIAADLPSTKAPAVMPVIDSVDAWTGFYIGANVGYGGGAFNYPVAIGAITGSGQLNSSGFVAGGQIGYNRLLTSKIVGGLEADLDGAGIQGKLGLNATSGVNTLALSAGSQLNYLGTVRARLGYLVMDPVLVYATGGYAYAGSSNSIGSTYNNVLLGALSKSTMDAGWTIGGGVEYKLTDALSLKTEYLYANLGTQTLASGLILRIPASLRVNETVNIVRVGLDYRFGGPEPIVAKY